MQIQGNIVDIRNRRIFKGEITVKNNRIESIQEKEHNNETFIIPGFVDAHIHIESSMLAPSEFAKIAVLHGTVATVSDPHEIANVLGMQGVEYMIENAKQVPLKFNFGAPSCVPATTFETAGAIIDSNDIKTLLQKPEIKYLAEMMNYPGVIFQDEEVLKKIQHALDLNKPVDGHAPGLRGEDLDKYLSAGISTDHECFTYEEAKEKLEKGMKVIIREGSAAKNFEALINLLSEHYNEMMFCSDDKHPDDLLIGHINQLCARAIAKGIDVFKVLQAACLNPIEHYNLDVGTLQQGDFADFIVVNNLTEFNVLQTYINGEALIENGKSKIQSIPLETPNNFNITKKSIEDFQLKSEKENVLAIQAINGELITKKIESQAKLENGFLVSNTENDILKIVVINRYENAPTAIGFIKGFGLKQGAIGSSVAHDCHNIVVVGTSDEEICEVVNQLIDAKGGLAFYSENQQGLIPLPIAGIMSDKDAQTIGKQYEDLDKLVKQNGCDGLDAPFMTLSFMALLVIPELKMSDKGLFDGKKFEFVALQE